MMYRTIDAAFWTDSKVRRLSPEDRLLFLYLITNPHTHVSGIYYLPIPTAIHETGLTEKQVRKGIDTLSTVGICAVDTENELIWIRRMFAFQGSGQKNAISAAHHLSKDLHNSFLIKEFCAEYPAVSRQLEKGFLDRVSDRVSIGNPVGATPDSPLQRTENREQRTEQESPGAEKRAGQQRDDLAYEHFAEEHLRHLGVAYVSKRADFVHLSALRKAAKLGARDAPTGWNEAVSNYFGSPLSAYTLGDLVVRFPVFKLSPVDRYGKPVNHANGGQPRERRKTQFEIADEGIAEFLRRHENDDDSGGSLAPNLQRRLPGD